MFRAIILCQTLSYIILHRDYLIYFGQYFHEICEYCYFISEETESWRNKVTSERLPVWQAEESVFKLRKYDFKAQVVYQFILLP